MARIFITGSADGLGQAAARRLVALGHEIVLHGRSRDRAQQALRAVPGARTALEGDLASMEQTRDAERMFAKRMGATIIEVPSSHLAMVSHPAEVVRLIEAAANVIAVKQ